MVDSQEQDLIQEDIETNNFLARYKESLKEFGYKNVAIICVLFVLWGLIFFAAGYASCYNNEAAKANVMIQEYFEKRNIELYGEEQGGLLNELVQKKGPDWG